MRRFKESKKQFDKVSEEKEAALIKNAQAPRNKPHEVEEANGILSATRKCFRHIVLDYVLQVNTHLQCVGIQDEQFSRVVIWIWSQSLLGLGVLALLRLRGLLD